MSNETKVEILKDDAGKPPAALAPTPAPPAGAPATPEEPEKPEKAGKKGKAGAPAKPKSEKAPGPRSAPGKMVLLGVAGGALVLGGVTGSLVVAPRLLARRPPTARAAAAALEESGGEKKHAKKGEEKSSIYELENIIVNPAGSAGTRFLMATVAFETSDKKAEDSLRENGIRVRDLVISILENQTMEELTRPGARDRAKTRIIEAIAPLAGGDDGLRVYLPQFVIQ